MVNLALFLGELSLKLHILTVSGSQPPRLFCLQASTPACPGPHGSPAWRAGTPTVGRDLSFLQWPAACRTAWGPFE